VYAFQITSGTKLHGTLQELAADWSRLIRSVQPEGAVMLVGYSMGCTVAWALCELLGPDTTLVLVDGSPTAPPIQGWSYEKEMAALIAQRPDMTQEVIDQCSAFYRCCKAYCVNNLTPKLRARHVTLVRPSEFNVVDGVRLAREGDLGVGVALAQGCTLETLTVRGTHTSIIQTEELAEVVSRVHKSSLLE